MVVLLSTGLPLSARQIVRRVERAERSVLERARAPVVYQRLEIARRRFGPARTPQPSDSWTGDLWTDLAQRRHRSRATRATGATAVASARGGTGSGKAVSAAARHMGGGDSSRDRREVGSPRSAFGTGEVRGSGAAGIEAGDDDALDALLRVFDRLQMSDSWPVSGRAHERLLASGESFRRETVRTDLSAFDGRLLTLEATSPDLRAALVVRERDWHPVEQRLTVRDGMATTEFVVREIGFEVIPLSSLPSAFFDRPETPPPTLMPPGVPDALADSRRPALPAASELITAEVEAMFALHRFGLTAEDEITVRRRDEVVEVSGLTTTAERRRRLVASIATIRHVRARVQTTDEVLVELGGTPAVSDRNGTAATPFAFAAATPPEATAGQGVTAAGQVDGPGKSIAAAPAPHLGRPGAFAPDGARNGVTSGVPAVGSTAAPLAGAAVAAPQAAAASSPATSESVPRPPLPLELRIDETTIAADRLPVQALAGTLQPAGAASDPNGATSARPAVPRADEASMRRAREAVRQSLALLERGWSLRRVAEWSRRTDATAVTASTRGLIELMAKEHADAAAKALAALDRTVRPALPVAAKATDGADETPLPALEPGRVWVEIATDFFGIAAEIDRDTRRLFTVSPDPTTEAAEEARRLRRGLDHAARWLEALQQTRP
ncbi:MAG: hypothetical protein ABIT71_25665 [Vicinamibacteraceae bacterium]